MKNNYKSIYLLGDIHGEWSVIKQSMSKLNKIHGPNNYNLIQLGEQLELNSKNSS